MDDTQDLLRRLSRHRDTPRPARASRPAVRLHCWRCGATLLHSRPSGSLPCACGGVLTEKAPDPEGGEPD